MPAGSHDLHTFDAHEHVLRHDPVRDVLLVAPRDAGRRPVGGLVAGGVRGHDPHDVAFDTGR